MSPKPTRKRKCPVTSIDNFTKDAIVNKIYNYLNRGLILTNLFKKICVEIIILL